MDDGSSAVTEDRLLVEFYVEMMLMRMITLLTFRLCYLVLTGGVVLM